MCWQGARIVGDIGQALEGCNFAAAVSARLREFSPPVWTPRAFAGHIAGHVEGQPELVTALIFGNERFGLPNQIVEQCNVLINIPANPALLVAEPGAGGAGAGLRVPRWRPNRTWPRPA